MLPSMFQNRLSLPAMAAPMFLVSGPDLVVETCKAGMIGTFPSFNHRTPEGYGRWLSDIRGRLSDQDAPFGVQFSIHMTNERLDADLALTLQHQVPILITELAVTREVTDAVHAYGGQVFHGATTVRHAVKGLEAGVDGIIAVSAGAGGHGGTYNPFAFTSELRPIVGDKVLIQAGAISDGQGVAGAVAAGADLASIGTAFICTTESMAAEEMKQAMVAATAKDILYTDKVSGLYANFLRDTVPIDASAPEGPFNVTEEISPKRWRDIWTAGHGVGSIHDIVPASVLVDRLAREFRTASSRLSAIAATPYRTRIPGQDAA
ncbi:MAG: nitronate monooxygenase [Alphaproteobacteria bacterium]|nr:nitronate monooxygenase [Alphaproteobacteria bacterium]MBU2380574.1 nitronate monooxygenase [Alphaproteobacteria bacterium]